MNEKHPDQIRWNQKYRDRDLASSPLNPSPFLKAHEEELRALPKESHSNVAALDIACGDGRNSFYLASLGFTVDAVDISDVAIAFVEEQTKARGAAVNPIQLDLAGKQFPQQHYSVIVCFRYLQRDLFPLMLESLLPGGLLIFETMHRDFADKLGHQMNPDFLLGDNELLRAFSDLRVLYYQEGVRVDALGATESAMASMVATRMK